MRFPSALFRSRRMFPNGNPPHPAGRVHGVTARPREGPSAGIHSQHAQRCWDGGSPEGPDVPNASSAAPSGPLCFFLGTEKEDASEKRSLKECPKQQLSSAAPACSLSLRASSQPAPSRREPFWAPALSKRAYQNTQGEASQQESPARFPPAYCLCDYSASASAALSVTVAPDLSRSQTFWMAAVSTR